MRARRTAGAVLSVVLGAGTPAIVGSPAAAAPNVCQGVRGCTVVARVDVDGDGTRDAVGVARRGAKGAPEGRVLVRVALDSGIVTARRKTSYWYGTPFHGAADINGGRGRELVLGATTGAHTSWYWVLTWRAGALRTLRAPAFGKHWPVDAAANVAVGWHRRAEQPPRQVTLREASRVGTSRRFAARTSTYRWAGGRWTLVDRDRKWVSEARAWSWGGWHVPGLPRW